MDLDSPGEGVLATPSFCRVVQRTNRLEPEHFVPCRAEMHTGHRRYVCLRENGGCTHPTVQNQIRTPPSRVLVCVLSRSRYS